MNHMNDSYIGDEPWNEQGEEIEVKICGHCWNEVAISEAIIFTEQFRKGTAETILCPSCAEYERVQNGFDNSHFKPLL